MYKIDIILINKASTFFLQITTVKSTEFTGQAGVATWGLVETASSHLRRDVTGSSDDETCEGWVAATP